MTSTRSDDKIDVAMLVISHLLLRILHVHIPAFQPSKWVESRINIVPPPPSAATSAWRIACMAMMKDNQWRDEGQSLE